MLIVVWLPNINHVGGFVCSTPDEWLGISGNNPGVASFHALKHTSGLRLWPNGHVRYKLEGPFTREELTEVYAAFEAYHRQTCIRFVPYKDGDNYTYTSISVNNNLHGKASVCMKILEILPSLAKSREQGKQ